MKRKAVRQQLGLKDLKVQVQEMETRCDPVDPVYQALDQVTFVTKWDKTGIIVKQAFIRSLNLGPDVW